MIITPISTLDAVNEILSSVGESPVNTLSENNNVDVMNALRLLKMVSREVQSRGWTFNTVQRYILDNDALSKKIKWDANILFIRPIDGRIIVNRNGYAYDVTNQTGTFDSPIEAVVYYAYPFEELPQVFRRFITARTCKMFTSRYMGDSQLINAMEMEESQAYMGLMEYEIDLEQPSMSSSQAVRQVMKR